MGYYSMLQKEKEDSFVTRLKMSIGTRKSRARLESLQEHTGLLSGRLEDFMEDI